MLIHSLPFQPYFHKTSSYPQSRNLGTGHPKLFCTACGGYDHWRKDCPYDCHCDNCATVTHTPPTCVEHHQNLPLPPLHNLLFVFIVAVQTIGQWSAGNHVPEITERRAMYPAQCQTSTLEKNNEKSAIAPSEISKKSNGKSRNNDKPRTLGSNNPQRPATDRQHHQQPQCLQHKANTVIIIVFLTGITGIMINRDRQDSMKSRIKCILLTTLPLHLHSLQALTCSVAL